MTQRVADDFAAIRRRMEELTAEEELKHVETDTGDEHTIAVQPSTGKRYKWINGSWTEEEYSLTGYPAHPCSVAGELEAHRVNTAFDEDLGSIDHKPSQTWQQSAQQYYDWLDRHKLTYEEWAKQGHTLLDYMI